MHGSEGRRGVEGEIGMHRSGSVYAQGKRRVGCIRFIHTHSYEIFLPYNLNCRQFEFVISMQQRHERYIHLEISFCNSDRAVFYRVHESRHMQNKSCRTTIPIPCTTDHKILASIFVWFNQAECIIHDILKSSYTKRIYLKNIYFHFFGNNKRKLLTKLSS